MKKVMLITMMMVFGFKALALESGTLECVGTYLNSDDETVLAEYTLEITDQHIMFYEDDRLEAVYGIGLDWVQDGETQSYKIERYENELVATFSEAPLDEYSQPMNVNNHYMSVIELVESSKDGSIASIKRSTDPNYPEDNYSRVDSCIRVKN